MGDVLLPSVPKIGNGGFARSPVPKIVHAKIVRRLFPDMPCMKRVYKDKYVGVSTLVSSQERRALAAPRIKRGSTAGFVPPSVYIRFPLFVLLKRRSGQLSSMPGGTRDGRLLGELAHQRPVLPVPAPPRRSSVRRPDPTRPWYIQALESTAGGLRGCERVLRRWWSIPSRKS